MTYTDCIAVLSSSSDCDDMVQAWLLILSHDYVRVI